MVSGIPHILSLRTTISDHYVCFCIDEPHKIFRLGGCRASACFKPVGRQACEFICGCPRRRPPEQGGLQSLSRRLGASHTPPTHKFGPNKASMKVLRPVWAIFGVRCVRVGAILGFAAHARNTRRLRIMHHRPETKQTARAPNVTRFFSAETLKPRWLNNQTIPRSLKHKASPNVHSHGADTKPSIGPNSPQIGQNSR